MTHRHVALWKFADDITPGEKREKAVKFKAILEDLAYELHGLIAIAVHIDSESAPGDGADIYLECRFENREARQTFLEHPRHAAARKLVDACTERLLCMDFKGSAVEAP